MSIKNAAFAATSLAVLALFGCNGAIPGEAKKKAAAAGTTGSGTASVKSSSTGPVAPVASKTAATPATTTPATATSATNPNVNQLLNLINASRQKLGLPPLLYSPILEQCGQRHVEATYAAANGVYQAFPTAAHIAWKQGDTCQPEGGATNENQSVGLGSDVQSSIIALHENMMNEGPPPPGCQNHYSAITNPGFTQVGIGMKIGPDGAVWVSEEFR